MPSKDGQPFAKSNLNSSKNITKGGEEPTLIRMLAAALETTPNIK